MFINNRENRGKYTKIKENKKKVHIGMKHGSKGLIKIRF